MSAGVFCAEFDLAVGEPTQAEQAELFESLPSGLELLLPAEVQKHKFTAEIVARNRLKYQAIVNGLAEGLGVRQMARAFGVSHHTVQTIRQREPALVAALKEGFGRRLLNCAGIAVERLEEGLETGTITDNQLPVTVGILTDKILAWSGQSMPKTEIRLEVSVERVKGLFVEMAGLSEPTARVGEAKVIDLAPQDATESQSGRNKELSQ